MAARRLIPASTVAEAEKKIAAAVGQAVDAQRRTVHASMRSAGLTASAVPTAAVWSPTAWAKAVNKHVAPVAQTVASSLAASAKASATTTAVWGAAVATTAMAAHVVNTALKAGERVGSVLANAAGGDDAMAAVDVALDSAAGWVGDLAGAVAGAVANWVTSDVLTHMDSQNVLTYTVTWNAVGDDRTRPDHADADGQTVSVGDTFSVGGEDLLYPGDPSGSDGNVLNCRCYLTYSDGSGNN